MGDFTEKLLSASALNRSWLCVGLDPDSERLPAGFSRDVNGVRQFLREILAGTAHLVCAYKPNAAFFEQMGWRGYRLLEELRGFIPDSVPMILDAKRGDIGHTAEAYARAVFDDVGADAVTLNPLLGSDSLRPFIERQHRGSFMLALTSNAGAEDFQLPLGFPAAVCARAHDWRAVNRNVGFVMGATRPDQMAALRADHPDALVLVPGVGAQGGDLESVIRHGRGAAHLNLIISASRSILYHGHSDVAAGAAVEAEALRHSIEQAQS